MVLCPRAPEFEPIKKSRSPRRASDRRLPRAAALLVGGCQPQVEVGTAKVGGARHWYFKLRANSSERAIVREFQAVAG